MITTEDVKHIARLSKLEYSPEELENFKAELNKVVEYVNTIQAIDTSGADLSLNCVDITSLREDVARPGLTNNEVIDNAPQKKDGGFYVPSIIEE